MFCLSEEELVSEIKRTLWLWDAFPLFDQLAYFSYSSYIQNSDWSLINKNCSWECKSLSIEIWPGWHLRRRRWVVSDGNVWILLLQLNTVIRLLGYLHKQNHIHQLIIIFLQEHYINTFTWGVTRINLIGIRFAVALQSFLLYPTYLASWRAFYYLSLSPWFILPPL